MKNATAYRTRLLWLSREARQEAQLWARDQYVRTSCLAQANRLVQLSKKVEVTPMRELDAFIDAAVKMLADVILFRTDWSTVEV